MTDFGVFNLEKAKGIKGLTVENYVKLQRGQEVTLKDGRIVSPNEVLDKREKDPIKCAAFIFMPDHSYIDSFVDQIGKNAFKDFSCEKTIGEDKMISTVYHSVPKRVMLDTNYLKTISSHFGPGVHHVLDCPESNLPQLALSEANFFADKIKLVCPHIFRPIFAEDLLKNQIENWDFENIKSEISVNSPEVASNLHHSFIGFQCNLNDAKNNPI